MSGDTSMYRAPFDTVSDAATTVAPGPAGGTVELGLDRLDPTHCDEEGPALEPHVAVRRLADSTRICRCRRVTKGAIVAAIRGGHCSLEALGQSTSAGTGCGSCHARLRKL